MKLKINKLKVVNKPVEEKPIKKKGNSLPPDTYKPVLDSEPKELFLDDEGESKLVFSVKRRGDDGLPHVDVRLWVQTEMYTGLTKKGITFNSEMLLDFMEIMNELREELEEKGF